MVEQVLDNMDLEREKGRYDQVLGSSHGIYCQKWEYL